MSREIDALVAEHVMGLHVSTSEEPYELSELNLHPGTKYIGKYGEPVPAYSSSIEAAWLVVEKLRPTCGFGLDDWPEIPIAKYEAEFAVRDEVGEGYPSFKAEADTAPLAICLAALKACGVSI